MPRIVIVGAGISGLSLAFRLQQLGDYHITVLEQRERPGGTVWTHRQDGFQIEAGPNGFLDTKPATLELCRDLGMKDQLVAASPEAAMNRYLMLDGHLRRLPGGLLDFLRSDLLSWRGKADLVMELFRAARMNGRDESIAAFARRRAGPEVARVIADALVTGIYAGDPALLSVRSCFPRLVAWEKEYGSVLKGLARPRRRRAQATGTSPPRPGTIWSLARGLGSLIETLCQRLHSPPSLSVMVRSLRRQDNAWLVQGRGEETWQADAVILACPAHAQASILAQLDGALADRIGSIPYNRIAVLALGYRRTDVPGSLAGFGYIAPQHTRRDVLGVQWCSSIFPERAPDGMVLLRALAGGWHRPEVAGWDDARLLDSVRGDLRQTMSIRAAPLFHHIVRWNRAIPQYHLGHLERVTWIEERARRYPGLFLAGNAYHGVALNDCTEQANILANRIKKHLMTWNKQSV